jgi:hypothetical protein
MGEESVEKIYGPVYDNGIWRIRTNNELMALYQELDTVSEIKKARLRCSELSSGLYCRVK